MFVAIIIIIIIYFFFLGGGGAVFAGINPVRESRGPHQEYIEKGTVYRETPNPKP